MTGAPLTYNYIKSDPSVVPDTMMYLLFNINTQSQRASLSFFRPTLNISVLCSYSFRHTVVPP